MEYPRRELAQGDSTKLFVINAPTGITFDGDYSASIVVKSALGSEQSALLTKAMTVEPDRIYGALEPTDTTSLPIGDLYITVQVVNIARTPQFTREKTYLYTLFPQGA